MDEQISKALRDQQEKERLENARPSLESIKAVLLDIEQAYTDWATPLKREWEL